MTDTDTPRAWVGCLGCYNAGKLIGRWLDDPDEIREYRCPEPVTEYDSHEELWVFDHENMPLLSGECAPVTFAEAIEFLETLDHRPRAAFGAWLANEGRDWRQVDLDEFDDALCGEFSDLADYAQEIAEECGMIPDDVAWPLTCIDWHKAARELEYDGYWTADNPDGGVYVFRST